MQNCLVSLNVFCYTLNVLNLILRWTVNVFNTCYVLCVPDCQIKYLRTGFCCCFLYNWCLLIRGEVNVLYLILPLLFIPLLCSCILWFNILFEKVLRLFWLAEIWDRLAVKVWFNLRIIHLVFTASISIFRDYSGLSCNRKANDILCSVTVMLYGNTEVRCRMGM